MPTHLVSVSSHTLSPSPSPTLSTSPSLSPSPTLTCSPSSSHRLSPSPSPTFSPSPSPSPIQARQTRQISGGGGAGCRVLAQIRQRGGCSKFLLFTR